MYFLTALLVFSVAVNVTPFAPPVAQSLTFDGAVQVSPFTPRVVQTIHRRRPSRNHRTIVSPLHAWKFSQKQPAQQQQRQQQQQQTELLKQEKKMQISLSLPYSAAWVGLLSFAFFLAPGELNSPQDQAILAQFSSFIQSREIPDINAIFFSIFNLFTVVPGVLCALILPSPPPSRGRFQFHPASPFLLGASFLGYFALGPYLMTRRLELEGEGEKISSAEDLGFFTRNIFESKLFAGSLLLATLVFLAPLAQLSSGGDFGETWKEFVSLVGNSRFVAVSCVDLFILTAICSVLVGEDTERRGKVPANWRYVPLFGPLLWLLSRPPVGDR